MGTQWCSLYCRSLDRYESLGRAVLKKPVKDIQSPTLRSALTARQRRRTDVFAIALPVAVSRRSAHEPDPASCRDIVQSSGPRRGQGASGSAPVRRLPRDTVSRMCGVRHAERCREDPNLAGRTETTPLEDASARGFDSVVGLLIDHGALVDRVNSGSGETALMPQLPLERARWCGCCWIEERRLICAAGA